MRTGSRERGQALILIVFAIVGLVAITGLAVDGGMAYSDRRAAQNAADNAALAAALADVREGDPTAVALSAAATNGFNNNGASNTVKVSMVNAKHCRYNGKGKDITVQITSHLRTYFGPVVGVRQLTNVVQAISRSCEPYVGPLFDGNAIVALGPKGGPRGVGFDATGNPKWDVTGGGIFSNATGTPSARCKGSGTVVAPSLTTVGGVEGCGVPATTTGVSPYVYADYASLLPRVPACNGMARRQGALWMAQAGADGSRVALNGDMNFGPGLFCVTNSPGPYHGQISGVNTTFYLIPSNFSLKFSGGGSFNATAPTAGEYTGVLMFSLPADCINPLQNTQSIDLRGNGSGTVPTGSIIVPCASVTMFGNSNGKGYNTQIIAYNVDSGGTPDIRINYDAGLGYNTNYPAWLTLLK